MSLYYDDIVGEGKVFVDAQEKGRANRFKEYLDNYLDGKTNSELEEMDVLKTKKENNEEYFEITSLEYGDYAYDNVVVEFKNYEDFKTSIRKGELTTQVENLYSYSDFKDKMLVIVCDDLGHFMRDDAQWKGVVRFNSKINATLVKDERMAFEAICHFFRLNSKHVSQPPRSKMRHNDNYAANLLWATRSLSDKQVREVINKTGLNTIPEAIELFTKYSAEELHDKLNIKGLTIKRINKCQKRIKGEIFL